ncbi:MAG: 2,3-bisphosphoglycerate-independent phosphoglycerate mutase [candidate division WS6 bacterium GW2011_GWF2_39_15]|uniref:2,3-bisphosphoglycerate-independent phosphoglycerate mutase n=1 Tax=candidate division WS6 bacterium GW2011_GWF2_39_15 TaxID=1619100 RepID=A0A0G0QWP7_9BACT|nr:MAG: 2,3-bisphosphoglycerate-independent phosphoglycerate mutase [candidate division WS6 bacterium GW2011_GWF2_39_15]
MLLFSHNKKLPMKKKVLLIIMDGLGAAPQNRGNAVSLANPKNLIQLWDTFPHTYLLASSEAVGLPANTKGNSEVGHLNIGAGNVVTQTLPRINKSITGGSYQDNNTLWEALRHAIKHRSNIHLMGCLSDGSVHSHINHFIATIEFFAANNFTGEVLIHAFTDGRDTPPDHGRNYLAKMQNTVDKLGIGRIATVCGRSIAMDRSMRWGKTEAAYNLLTRGEGERFNAWSEVFDRNYSNGITDEFIKPAVISQNGVLPTVKSGDAVIFMNYRADRALQLTSAFTEPQFTFFSRELIPNLFFASMVEYRKGTPLHVLFPKEYITLPIGKVLSNNGIRQLRISETEKFPHVTYFFNGGMSIKYQGEDRIEVPSANVATYDLKPEMSAMEIQEILKYRISTDMYDFIVLNLANGDMVGHTGNINASIKAVQVVDHCVNELVKRFTAAGGVVIITADHGNVEEVINLKSGEIDTEHSFNPVPFIIADPDMSPRKLPYGALKDIAPTILDIMDVPIPSEMGGKSLIRSL